MYVSKCENPDTGPDVTPVGKARKGENINSRSVLPRTRKGPADQLGTLFLAKEPLLPPTSLRTLQSDFRVKSPSGKEKNNKINEKYFGNIRTRKK
ncbi:hypothetical protein CEXT_516551 [Caerostris extrusa]|uniref:Uncharacterized protein n=1 Tax=Caerostris extrusa TaxID=172846 RepID=A0AAV4PST3_CAEEX|nr:hypothetical protein CEXT_516551 [Caerostris extrusa]